MVLLTMIKSYIENRKARKKWKLNRQNDFAEWLDQQFTRAYNEGRTSKNDIDTIVFQYWESEKLISTYISPNGFYCRHIIPEDFIRWPINDELIKPTAIGLTVLLKSFALNQPPYKLQAIPEKGYTTIHLLSENGWLSTGIQQSEASLKLEWKKIIEMEKQVASIYKKQLPLHDRDYTGTKS